MHKLVSKGQKHSSTQLKTFVHTLTGLKGLYHFCISIIVSPLSLYCIHKPPKDKSTPTYGLKPLCVFIWAPKTSHHICVTVTGKEEYCPMILQTMFYTHIHEHISIL